MRISGHDLAGPVPAEAGGTFFEHSTKARVPLTDSRQSGNRGIPEDDGLVAHPLRVMPCRVDGLTDLNHDIRELRLVIEAGGRVLLGRGMARRDIHADAFFTGA